MSTNTDVHNINMFINMCKEFLDCIRIAKEMRCALMASPAG